MISYPGARDFPTKFGLTKISRIKKKRAGDLHAKAVGLLRLKRSTSAVQGERTRLNEEGDEGIAGYWRESLKMRVHKGYKFGRMVSADHLAVFELRIGENAENPLVFLEDNDHGKMESLGTQPIAGESRSRRPPAPTLSSEGFTSSNSFGTEKHETLP